MSHNNVVDILKTLLDAEGDCDTLYPQLPYHLIQLLIDNIPDMIFVKDREFRLVLVNRAFCEKTGMSRDDIIGKNAHDLYPKEIADVYLEKDRQLFESKQSVQNEEWIVDQDGNRAFIDTVKVPCFSEAGKLAGMIAVSRDITDKRKLQIEREILTQQLEESLARSEQQHKLLLVQNQKLEKLSTTDELTQLDNRRGFFAKLSSEWLRAKREQKALSIFLMDIDYFKTFNDNFGHLVGDQCIQAVANVLNETLCRPGDVAARFGGDEFIALLPDTDSACETVIKNCYKEINQISKLHPKWPEVMVSVGGVSINPTENNSYTKMIQEADKQLFLAKKAGRNQYRYHSFVQQSSNSL